MNIERLHSIIDTLNVVGINQCILERKEDSVFIRGEGMSKTLQNEDVPSIAVLSETSRDVIDNTMAVSRVQVFLNRMNLFKLENTKVNTSDSEKFTKSMVMKEGRRKASFTFSDPKTLEVPSGKFQDEVKNQIVLTKEYIADLAKANTAFKPEYFTLSGINKEIHIELNDGMSDSFTDIIGTNQTGEWNASWRMDSVMKLLRQAIKETDEVELAISNMNVIYIELNGIMFMVLPQAV